MFSFYRGIVIKEDNKKETQTSSEVSKDTAQPDQHDQHEETKPPTFTT